MMLSHISGVTSAMAWRAPRAALLTTPRIGPSQDVGHEPGIARIERNRGKGPVGEDGAPLGPAENALCHLAPEIRAHRHAGEIVAPGEMDAVTLGDMGPEIESPGAAPGPA